MIRAFLDSSTVLDAVQGGQATELFAPELRGRVKYLVNPIVLQEILLAAEQSEPRLVGRLEHVLDHSIEVIPLDGSLLAGRHRDRLRRLRDTAVHSNDILIMSSADDAGCNYLITSDRDLLGSAAGEPFRTVTPSEFLETVGAAA